MDFFRNAAFGMDNGSLLNLIQLHTGPYLVPKYKPIRNGGMEIFRNAAFGMGNGSCFAISPNTDVLTCLGRFLHVFTCFGKKRRKDLKKGR